MEEANMRMNLKRKSILAAVALTVVAAPIASAARDDRDDVTSYRARLTGFGEVPPKLVDGQGRFTGTLSADGASISWTLTWADLTGAAQAAHIHFGQPQNTGSVVVFFCGGGGRPACPDGPGHSGSGSRPGGAGGNFARPPPNNHPGGLPRLPRSFRAPLGGAHIHTPPISRGGIPGQ